MSRIFLSHATEEHDLVVHLANYIEKNGLEAWYAPRNIMGGIDYDKEIIAAIRDCRAFVLILSHNSDASEDVKTEVYHAVKFKKRVICLDVEDIEPENLSYLLGMRHRLNWLERRDETLDKPVHDIKMIPDPASRKITKPIIEAKPTAETEAVLQKLRQKRKSEPKQESQMQASEPEKERRPKISPGKIIMWAAVIAFFVFSYAVIHDYNKRYENRIDILATSGTPEEIREAVNAGEKLVTAPTGANSLTTLYLAARYNTAEAVKAVIEAGADVNATGYYQDENALMAVFRRPYNKSSEAECLEIAELLISAGTNVNFQSYLKRTALMMAAGGNDSKTVYPEIVKFLLKHGADKNIRDADGLTAYDFASKNKDVDSSVLALLRPDTAQ